MIVLGIIFILIIIISSILKFLTFIEEIKYISDVMISSLKQKEEEFKEGEVISQGELFKFLNLDVKPVSHKNIENI